VRHTDRVENPLKCSYIMYLVSRSKYVKYVFYLTIPLFLYFNVCIFVCLSGRPEYTVYNVSIQNVKQRETIHPLKIPQILKISIKIQLNLDRAVQG